MKKNFLTQWMVFLIFLFLLSGISIGSEDLEARITKASNGLFDMPTSKEDIINSLVEFLDVSISLMLSSEYGEEIKHQIDVAKDLIKTTSIFNEKARQYVAMAYRMVTGGVKYQSPPELDEFVTPTEQREKGTKYAKKLVENAQSSLRQGEKVKAAKFILELVLMIITPVSG